MRTIISGSRGLADIAHVRSAFRACPWWREISAILSGECPNSPDMHARTVAEGLGVPFHPHPADWSRGRRAGPERNARMVEAADALIAVWNGRSKGTGMTIRLARERGLRVFVYVPEG